MTRFTLHRHTTFPRIGGGDPFDVDTRTDEEAFPRIGGGDPACAFTLIIVTYFSPHRRG